MRVDIGSCTFCGICEAVCSFNAIKLQEVPEVDWEICTRCGVCASKCPSGAISMSEDL